MRHPRDNPVMTALAHYLAHYLANYPANCLMPASAKPWPLARCRCAGFPAAWA